MSSYAPVRPPPGPPPRPDAASASATPATPPTHPPLSNTPRRMLVQPPAISTSLHRNGNGNNSSAATAYLQAAPSAVSPPSSAQLFSPHMASPGTHSQPSTAPTSASRTASPMAFRGSPSAYNPQEWRTHGSGQFLSHAACSPAALRGSTRDVTGMEASMPSPPPPYSPSPAQQSMSAAVGASPSLSSDMFPTPQSTCSPRIGILNQSPSAITPSTQAAPSFPPPPPPPPSAADVDDRTGSRTREKRSKFGLSALSGRSRGGGGGGTASGIGGSVEQSSSAINALRLQTTEVLARTPGPLHPFSPVPVHGFSQQSVAPQIKSQWIPDAGLHAPAARRAASTGGIGISIRDGGSATAASRPAAWEPGMPLPGPPPGPPPSGSRSQSTNRTPKILSASATDSTPAAAPRRAAAFGSALGPVPPTPADWREEDVQNRSKFPGSRPLHLATPVPSGQEVTDHANMNSAHREPQTASASTSRGIRERRSESRAARGKAAEVQSAIEPSNNPWARDMEPLHRPTNLILTADSGMISQRRRNTPRSGHSAPSPLSAHQTAYPSAESNSSFEDLQTGSNHATPRHMIMSPKSFAPTPPFSPPGESTDEQHASRHKPSGSAQAKTLPTPPPHSAGMSSSLSVVSSENDRPLSHILHTPLDHVPMVQPLHPSRPSSSSSAAVGRALTDQDVFARASLDRYREFIHRESAARTDQERLELFADFMVHESRLRRDRYPAAFEAMASDILDLTRDMWRSYTGSSAGRRSTTPSKIESFKPQHELQDSVSSAESLANVSPAVSMAAYSPRLSLESPLSAFSGHGAPGRVRGDSTAWQPCLSPIPSMAVSTVPDDEDSRGRSASRWWEGSTNGSRDRDLELLRTKREVKYMGVQLTEAQEYVQWENGHRSGGATPGPSDTIPAGLQQRQSEYPPEKVGWHDQVPPGAHNPPPHLAPWPRSVPTTPDLYKLDVSRLVTLPPSYPRHHPAVNNGHPHLASIRATLRALQHPEDDDSAKGGSRARSARLKETGIQRELDRRYEPGIGIAGALDVSLGPPEASLIQQACSREDFDTFQRDVMDPIAERIPKTTALIEQLKTGLPNGAQATGASQQQKEGDEQPELLEKLTLLKWLFEAREQFYKELFELDALRDDRCKALISSPYVAANNMGKVREVAERFSRNAQEREVAYRKQALKRFEEFHDTIEDNVTREVEDQLSAFWDIGPGLLDIVQRVPETLTNDFQILIPQSEYSENPSYHEHPLQYLFTLLSHAQKSAYQFIESQTNLLCLLHEVKTGVMMANTRLLRTQRVLQGEDRETVDKDMAVISHHEEERLTEDLKEKVNLAEEQWREALGKGIADCIARVQEFLIGTGGWDESLHG